MKRALLPVMFVLAALVASGCILRGTGTVSVPPPPTATLHVGAQVSAPPPAVVVAPPPPAVVRSSVAIPRPTLSANVQVMGTTCNPNAAEQLNGLDDNCNGQIDEGWVQSGELQITLGWSTAADLDLHVTEPSGFEIYYGDKQSASGAYLDRDARGQCTDGETGENIYWSGSPPAGHYRVEVNNYSGCNNNSPSTFVVSVAFNGEVVGSYQFTARPEETVNVLEFDL